MCIKDRLKQIIEMNGLNIKDSAELLGMPYRTWQNYLLGERDPNVETLIKIAHQFNINLNWLLLGDGDILKDNLNQNQLTDKENTLIQNYRKISDEAKTVFDLSLDSVSKSIQ